METIIDHIARQAEIRPDAPFLREGGISLTFAGFFTAVRRHAGFLADRGVRPGDRVVLYLDGRLRHLLGYFSAMALGAIPVHVAALRTRDHVAFAASHTGATLVLTDVAGFDPANLPCACVAAPDPTDAALPERWSRDRNDTAYMMFTSGTTGQPKAVMTSQANVLSVTRTLIGIAGLRAGDREIIVMPLASTGGLGHVHANLLVGNPAILLPYFFGAMDDDDLRHMLGIIEAEAITGFLSTPGMLGRLAEHHGEAFRRQARGVRYILANVTPMRPELVRTLVGMLPDTRFYTYYGLTEASRSVHLCYNDNLHRAHAAGRPAAGVAIGLAKPSAEASLGEVLIKGANVTTGYWGQPGLGFDGDGWFRTGDLGAFDDDGFLTLHGRLKDNIKVDGMECFPHEVEAVLERHPGVKECAVTAVPDHLTYERVGAAIVPRPGVDAAGLVEDLGALCRRELEVYKRPTQFLALDALPRQPLGKIDRQVLRTRLEEAGRSGATLPPAARTVAEGAATGTATGAATGVAGADAVAAPAVEQFETPLPEAFRVFRDGWTAARYNSFRDRLGQALGIHYVVNSTPFFLDRARFDRLAATTEAVVRLLRSPAYQAEIGAEPWFLPTTPIGPEDCVGSVDFHVGPEGGKVIEVNFFPPGFIGILELLEATLFDAFDLPGLHRINAGFEADLVDLVTEGRRYRRIALAVNHTAASVPYLNHYRYIEGLFRRQGVECRLVYARDVVLDAQDWPVWDGERFERVFTLVIPRIMEHGPEPFARYIELFHRRPEVIFPRPFGWKLGMKRMLADLHRLDPTAYGLSAEEAGLIADAALPAVHLATLSGPGELARIFDGRRFVLKPLDDYDKGGVYLHPTRADMERVFAGSPEKYIAQAWYPHPHMPVVTRRGEVAAHQFSLRMGFLGGRCRGIRGASFSDTQTYDDAVAPVVVV